MSAFRMGQRVRVARADGDEVAHLVGMEGRITEIMDGGAGDFYGLDIFPITTIGDEWYVGFWSHELEPILDKHAPCEEDFKQSLDRLLEREGVDA